MRLALAILVVYSHCFPLTSGDYSSEPFYAHSGAQISGGSFAVDIFFFISGMLITTSWFRSQSPGEYLRRRVLRIYPGYFVAMAFSAITAALAVPAFWQIDISWSWSGDWLKDVLLLSNDSLHGQNIFPDNPYKHSANGSLWTIQIEFICYLSVLLFGLLGILKKRCLVLIMLACAHIYYFLSMQSGAPNTDHVWSRVASHFLAGASAQLWRDRIPISGRLAITLLPLLLLTLHFRPWFIFVSPLLAGYLVLWFGFARPLTVLQCCDRTDLSYGVYLYSFPTQQLIAHFGVRNPHWMFLLTTPLALLIAFCSWKLCEKPCLQLKNHNPAILPVAGVH